MFGTKSFKSVKVVKEKFDADSNTFRESVVYQLPSGGEDFQAAASRSAPAQAPASQPRPRPQARAKAKPAKKKAKWGLLDFLKE